MINATSALSNEMPHYLLCDLKTVQKYTLNAHKLCGRAATVVATFALACSLPEERKVLCRLQISLSDQNNVYFGTPAQTLQTKKGGSFLISF